jgi:hypothetical protein
MTVDVGREAVYAAEIAAFEGTSYESLVDIDRLLDLAAVITSADWWPHGAIDVVPARIDASSSSTRQRRGARPVVRLAAPQMTPATLIHEFAHVLAGVEVGHGEVFRRAHVDLVGFVFGDIQANWLVAAYDAMGLEPGRRNWPSVGRATGGAIAL